MATLLLPAPAAPVTADDVSHDEASVPMRLVVDSGLRPIVQARIDGVDLPMLVHANAGFIAMVTHDALRRVSGRSAAKESDFGLGHDLALSRAGRGHVTVGSLAVAGSTLTDIRIEVFDLPTVNWEGMLGVSWLADVGALVDFAGNRLHVASRDAAAARLGRQRAQRIPLARDQASGRFGCSLSLERGGPAGRFVASTVAETTLDVEFARARGIELEDSGEDEHGPTGAVVPVARPVVPITLWSGADALAEVRPSVYDVYAYMGARRPPLEAAVAGYLGADLMVSLGAALDFGD